mgnify:CR=1 FL=1
MLASVKIQPNIKNSVKATFKKTYTHLISENFSDFLRLIIYLIEKAIKETNNTVRPVTKKIPSV